VSNTCQGNVQKHSYLVCVSTCVTCVRLQSWSARFT